MDTPDVCLDYEPVGEDFFVSTSQDESFWLEGKQLYAVNEAARAFAPELPTKDSEWVGAQREALSTGEAYCEFVLVESATGDGSLLSRVWNYLNDPNAWEAPNCRECAINRMEHQILRNDWQSDFDLFIFIEKGTAYHTPTGAILWYLSGQPHSVNEVARLEYPALPHAPETIDEAYVSELLVASLEDCVRGNENQRDEVWTDELLKGVEDVFEERFKDNPDAYRKIFGSLERWS